jgi:putative drug exporter of the RND superfamily
MKTFNKGIFRFRFLLAFTWTCIIIGFGYYALQLPDVLKGNGFDYDGEYKQTNRLLEENFGQGNIPIIIVFENNEGLSLDRWQKSIGAFFKETKKVSLLETQISPLHQPVMMKETIAYGIIFVKPMEDSQITTLLEQLKEIASRYKNVTITGESIMVEDLNTASQEDLAMAEMIGLPIALLVLIISFGGLVAASVPLVIGISSILVSMGIVYFFHPYIDLSIFILNIIPMIGLALSIDFALLFINRYKEELTSNSTENALITTLRTSGRSIIFSGLCVFIGLSGLLFIQIDIFQNVAIGGMIVVFVSILSSLTLLPLLLLLLGGKINSFSLFKIKGQDNKIWYEFACFVMRYPVIITLLALSALLVCLIPIKDIHLEIPGVDSIPAHYESRIAFEKYKENFIPKGQEEENELVVIIESDEELIQEKNLVKALEFINRLEKDTMVTYVESPFSLAQLDDPFLFLQFWETDEQFFAKMQPFIKDNKMLLRVFLDGGKLSSQTHTWVHNLNNEVTDFTVHLGGKVKFEQEIFNEIYDKAPFGLLFIVISTLIILTIAFRSILIPIKAIFMNILSLGATFGIVVWIFQYGHFNIEPVSIGLILPVFVFSLVFGLSMDYEVFLISRIHEVYLETKDNSLATITGLTSTSKIITSAAAIMIVITGAFSFTGVMPIKQIGMGIAIAILIDATIVRLLLVPALMKLLGDWNWWFFGLTETKDFEKEDKV